MKKIWVNIDRWDKKTVIAAIEGGADALVIPEGYSRFVSELGKIITVSKDGDLVPGIDVIFLSLCTTEDLDKIIQISSTKIVIVECNNWEIIPLENIIAQNGSNIIISVRNPQDAISVFGVLEKGILGVMIKGNSFIELKKMSLEFYNLENKIKLNTALVESVKNVGMGDRVCVDTCSFIFARKGMLIGNSSVFLFLIHAENIENSYVKARPFRINAGSVHSYTIGYKGKTNYLSELSSGKMVQIVDYKGSVESSIVGRIKIEKRPLLLVKAVSDGYIGSTILQNAETIRLIDPNGSFKSVTELKIGDEILVHIGKGGRHFGYEVEEYISEK